VLLLPLYSGYGFGLHRLRRWGERAGFSSHNAFIMSKASCRPPEVLRFFDQSPARPLALPNHGK
jgi:hypothetical protein